MKILFLSKGGGSCLSLIAKSIMQSFDSDLEVFAAGLSQLNCTVDELTPVLLESGCKIDKPKQYLPIEIKDVEFDFLITLCEGTKEEFYKLPLKYKRKLHLAFTNSEIINMNYVDKGNSYRELIEEIQTELSYFYYHILKKQ